MQYCNQCDIAFQQVNCPLCEAVKVLGQKLAIIEELKEELRDSEEALSICQDKDD